MRLTPMHAVCSFVLAICLSIGAVAEENWPRFGGASGDFTTSAENVPTKWNEDNVQWRVELGGTGQSSPIVWGDYIFVTVAEKTAGGKAARALICLRRADGKQMWKVTCSTGEGEALHKMNTWATPSCATDGEHVLAYFGPGGLHCYTVGGEHVWSHELVDPVGPWGFAASPIILGDRVIINADALGESFLAAFTIADGKEVWRTERREKPRGGWSTPILIDTGERKELVCNGEFGVAAYDPETGEELWFCQGFNGRGTPVPAYTNGVLVTVNGKPGDIYAVRPGGAGNVTETHMAWHTRRGGGRDLPSPVAAGDYVFAISMGGIGTLYDAKSGKEIWQARIGGNFSATPFVAAGLIYATSESGETIVIRPGDKLDIVSRNKLGDTGDEIFRASSTPHNGQVLLRSQTALYCVGA